MRRDSRVLATLRQSDPAIVALEGEVDQRQKDGVVRFLDSVRDAGMTSTRLDLMALDFMDPSVLGDIGRTAERFELFEVCAARHIATLFETHGLAGLLREAPEEQWSEDSPTWIMTSFSVPALLDSCQKVRYRIDDLTSRLPLSEEERADIRWAVGEAVSNAIRHGCDRTPWQCVSIRCLVDGESLSIEVADDGPGFDPHSVPLLDLSAPPDIERLPEGGMGISCMRRLMDEVSYDFSSRTTVRLVKLIRVPALVG